MIFVSSFRPYDGCPEEVWENQIAANRSWNRIAEKIFYFNDRDPRMASDKTMFLPTQGRPAIKTMAAFCGQLAGWSAILNADIVIPQSFRRVEDVLLAGDKACAVSKRYNMVEGDPSTGKVTDNGLDFFAANAPVWKLAGETIADDYRLGRIIWDTWMVNFFMFKFGNFCYDITPSRVVFHPIHDGRQDQNWDYNKNDEILKKNNWPFHEI